MACLHRLFTVCIFIAILLPRAGIAQGGFFSGYEKGRDSAIAVLQQYPLADTARVKALCNVYLMANFLKRKKEVRPYCEEALAISRKLSYPKGLAESYLFMGNFYRSADNPLQASLYFDSVLQVTSNENAPYFAETGAQAFRWKGVLLLAQENYYEALNNYFSALKYYEFNPSFATLYIYQDITIIYQRLENTDQAIFYSMKQASLAELKFPKFFAVSAYLSLVDIYIKKNALTPATNYLDKSKPYIPDSEEIMINISYFEGRGQVYFLQNRIDSAYYYFQLAYAAAKDIDHSESIMSTLDYLSRLSLKQGRLALAKKYALENLALAQQTNGKVTKVAALENLSAYYNKAGDKNNAFAFLQEATALKDSILSATNLKQSSTLAAIYETDKKQKAIFRLQNEKQAQLAAVKHDALFNKIFVGTIVSMLLFGWLASKAVKNERKITRQQQEIQQQKIKELESERQLLTADSILKGQEEERGRIAKDLHDGLGGMLSGVKLSFVNMKENLVLPAAQLSGFERSIQMLDNTIAELRKVAHNLMPESLVRFGLEESLKDFCQSIQTSTGIQVAYQQTGEKRKLATQAQLTIYRIVQELINNALKHAAASRIIVQLSQAPAKTGITVEDNGKGFDPGLLDMKKGAGFRNIKERVYYCKGNLDIHSQPGNGTAVYIELVT